MFYIYSLTLCKNTFYVEVQLIYNAVLVSGVQHSDSVIYIYIYLHSFSDSFPIYRVEFSVPYSRSLLIIYFIHRQIDNAVDSVSRSVISDIATPWTVAHQTPLSMEFSRKEYWSGQPFPSPGESSPLRVEPGSPALQADSLLCELPGKPLFYIWQCVY